jgi:serine/threonine-protein kinase
MASVWCAEDLVLGRSVAVKVLAERFAHDHLAVLRFKREARAAARVSNHPHVVTVYDVGELEPQDPHADPIHATGRAFIVMEFLAGGTVADAIRHDSVRRQEAMRWLREAASALDHAHARGIVHRDIKPANFLLDGTRVLHVADFGIARLMTEDTITTSDQLFGTAAYLSPEQALGQEATGASDCYALAVAAFELLAGERPFSAPHFSAQARQHIEEPPPAASDVDRTLPPAVDDVLFTGLAKDPANRPGSAGEFVAALQDALDGRRTPPRPAPTRRTRARMPDPAAPAASTAAARRHEALREGRNGGGPHPPTARMATLSTSARPRRWAALGALMAAVLVVAGIAYATTRGSGSHGASLAARSSATRSHRHHAHHAATARTTHARTTTHSTTTTSTTTAASAEDLESTGHEDIVNGDYSSAIPILQQAVVSAPHDTPTYAYALYDLGHAELLNGDPQAAIPILQKRLAIPDQIATVQATLDEALAQAGQAAPTTTTQTTPTAPTPTGPTPPGATTPHGGSGGAGGAGLAGQGSTTPHTPNTGTTAPGATPGATNPSVGQPASDRLHRWARRGHRGRGHGFGRRRGHGDTWPLRVITAITLG